MLGLRPIVALVAIAAPATAFAGPAAVSADAAAWPWGYVSASAGSDVENDCTDQYAPCATIQHAIDEAGPNPFDAIPSITVAPGTYSEQLTVDTPLSLHGPNSQTSNRGPEAVIDGGAGTAIRPEAANVTITGFTISTDSAGTPIRTTGTDVNRLTISTNIIEGGASGVWLGAGGDETDLLLNLIEGDEYGIRLGAAKYSDLKLWYNDLTGPVASSGVFAEATTEIDGFIFEGNEFATASLGASIKDGWVLANEVKPPAGGVGLEAHLTDSYVRENEFEGKGEGSCLRLLGGQSGLAPSTHVIVSDNEFVGCAPYALELGPEVEAISITANTFPGSYDGVVTDDSSQWDVPANISIWENRLVGLSHLGVYNRVGGELDARNNWWGCNGGPGSSGCDDVSSGVDSSPNVVLSGRAFEAGKDPWEAAPISLLNPGEKALIRAYLKNGDGSEALNVSIITDAPLHFSSPKGSLSSSSAFWQNALSETVFTAGVQPGPAEVVMTMDNQQVEVPLTIKGESQAILPSSPPGRGPQIRVPGRTLRLPKRVAVIGSVSCGQRVCQVEQKSAVVRVGRVHFDARLEVPTDIAAEGVAQIRVRLSRRVFRHLLQHGTGTLAVAIEITDAGGAAATLSRRVKIRP